MTPIPVKPYPVERSYDTPEAAIAGGQRHRLQPKAQSDAKQLEGATLVDGFWTSGEFVLRFSNGKWLHVFVEGQRVRWRVTGEERAIGQEAERVGAQPVVLSWGGEIGDAPLDRSALIAKRRGAQFTRLWVNEGGFYVYVRGHLILVFHAIRRTDTGEDMLFVTDED